MEKALTNLPNFQPNDLLWKVRDWKHLATTPGSDRLVLEWNVNRGPKALLFPAGNRTLALHLTDGAGDGSSDERWADFLELTFVPDVVSALEDAGFRVQTICVDQRPIQIMRQKRRAATAAAQQRTGHAAH